MVVERLSHSDKGSIAVGLVLPLEGDVEWKRLLSPRRFSFDGRFAESSPSARTPFERDWDRVLFSNAFRRLHDKTQVFPLPENDVVHSRLTHSLEVASVGKSLGKLVGRSVLARNPELAELCASDFGDIVAAACLAHDIGNPPFGHAGEDAISEFFRSAVGREATDDLEPKQRYDLEYFDGNAQGFRTLVRLQQEADGGLHLTAATLAAFVKYPRASGPKPERSAVFLKKHGFTQQDSVAFRVLAEETGLQPLGDDVWARHPLAYLVEAADDICYSILDVEDGVRLGCVRADECLDLMGALASENARYDPERMSSMPAAMDKISYSRALAISELIVQCVNAFEQNEGRILDGALESSLADMVPLSERLRSLRTLAMETCYQAPTVLEIELAGYEALGGLLGLFVGAVDGRKPRSRRYAKVVRLLQREGDQFSDGVSLYEKLLRVVDYVSGMTDNYALTTYRKLTGMALPGRSG